MRLATIALSLVVGCSAATDPPVAAVVVRSAGSDGGGGQPDAGAPEAAAPEASAPEAPAPEEPAPEAPPRAGALATLTPREIKLAERIHFKTDQPDILAESLPLLDEVAGILVSHPKVTVEIGCHSDNRGAPAHNLTLTQGRADAVRSYLAGKGVAIGRMTAVGYGQTRPISDMAPAQQRRCEFVRTDGR